MLKIGDKVRVNGNELLEGTIISDQFIVHDDQFGDLSLQAVHLKHGGWLDENESCYISMIVVHIDNMKKIT